MVHMFIVHTFLKYMIFKE